MAKQRNSARPSHRFALHAAGLPAVLRRFQPVVIGTPGLGIALPESDIDVACTWPDLNDFLREAQQNFGSLDNFNYAFPDLAYHGEPAVCVRFEVLGWCIELFCQTIPVARQWGVRHFQVQRRLLRLAPELTGQIVTLKRRGLKTEPAFAAALALTGDPYEALLTLETK